MKGNRSLYTCVFKSMKTCNSPTHQRMKQLLTGLVFIFCISCTSEKGPAPADNQANCDTVLVTSARMYAIVQENCTNRTCHPGSGTPTVADFSTLAKLKTYITDNGAMFRLRVTGPNADMPQIMNFPALSRATRDSIACWVGKGMPD